MIDQKKWPVNGMNSLEGILRNRPAARFTAHQVVGDDGCAFRFFEQLQRKKIRLSIVFDLLADTFVDPGKGKGIVLLDRLEERCDYGEHNQPNHERDDFF